MTDQTKQDARSIVVNVIIALVVGMGGAYMTARDQLARYEERAKAREIRLAALESKVDTLSGMQIDVKVLSERSKHSDDTIKRVEAKMDAALVAATERLRK